MNTLKHLNSLLVITILFALSSCQTDVEHADSLRLENKFDEAANCIRKQLMRVMRMRHGGFPLLMEMVMV